MKTILFIILMLLLGYGIRSTGAYPRISECIIIGLWFSFGYSTAVLMLYHLYKKSELRKGTNSEAIKRNLKNILGI